jgi:hypothetical protein
MVTPPKCTVSKVMETIKTNTRKALKIKFVFLKKIFWGDKGIWEKGYFVFTLGINEKIIKEYVKMQDKKRKIRDDKRSNNFESTTSVKAMLLLLPRISQLLVGFGENFLVPEPKDMDVEEQLLTG